MTEPKTIVSICDHSGGWSRPYVNAGYNVVRVDPKHTPGFDTAPDGAITFGGTAKEFIRFVHEVQSAGGEWPIHGLMLAPVCTDFTNSGARWWAEKDADGRTVESLKLVDECLELVRLLAPQWWVLENPVGRLPRLRPELGKPRMYFNPCDYAGFAADPMAEAYTKKTGLWGSFNTNLPLDEVEPVFYTKGGKRGSWMWANLGGKSERTKELRSVTPSGFAWAFFLANP
jgi:hypothetical protein